MLKQALRDNSQYIDRQVQSINNDITNNRNAFANAIDAEDDAEMNRLQAEYEDMTHALEEL